MACSLTGGVRSRSPLPPVPVAGVCVKNIYVCLLGVWASWVVGLFFLLGVLLVVVCG